MREDCCPRKPIRFTTVDMLLLSRRCHSSLTDKSCSTRTILETVNH